MNDWRTNKKYYHFHDDLTNYPDAWCYVVWSRRGPGKTYSALRYAYEEQIKMCYMKRTNDDVTMICREKAGIDLSPYVPINRDAEVNIKAKLLSKGVGGFYNVHETEDGPVYGPPISYLLSLNIAKSVKGFDLSDCDWVLLDEFIPQVGEVVKRKEGEMLLDVYMTIARDRVKRGRSDLKLILFANAENISTPITNELEIVDDMIDLQASGRSHLFIQDRGILLHHITEEEIPIMNEEMNSGIYRAMIGTSWGAKAFGGEFSNNDFSNVGTISLKNYQPVVAYRYKNKTIYVYRKEELLFFTYSQNNQCEIYNLNLENDQKRFYWDYVCDFYDECVQNRCKFKSYTMYDLIMNYKKFFNF